MRRLAFRFAIGVVTFAIGVAVMTCFRWVATPPIAPSSVIPEGWKKIDQNRFSFYVPPDIANGTHRGIDSEVWESQNSAMSLVYDYGEYSSDQHRYASQPEYHAEWFLISGKKAKVETLQLRADAAHWDRIDRRYLASVYFPDLGNSRSRLSFTAYCVDSTAQKTAKTILLSIRFK